MQYEIIFKNGCKDFLCALKNSLSGRMLAALYCFISTLWHKSLMSSFVHKETKISLIAEKSLWYRFIKSITTFPNKIKLNINISSKTISLINSIFLTLTYTIIFMAPLLPTMLMAALCILSLCVLVTKSLFDHKFKIKFGLYDMLCVSLLIVFALSSFTSFAAVKSLQIFVLYSVFMLFHFSLASSIQSEKQLKTATILLAIAGFFVSFYGILQYKFNWAGSGRWLDEQMFDSIKLRVYSTLENPNVLGEYLIFIISICAGLIFCNKKLMARFMFFVIFATCFAALILTYSRGCWLSILLSAAIFITLVNGRLWGIALITLPIALYFMPENIAERFSSIGNLDDTSSSYRLYIWLGTTAMLKDFWISGIGLGEAAFNSVYPFYSYNSVTAPHTHSLFLQILTENGLPGLIIFVMLIVTFFKQIILCHKNNTKNKEIYIMSTAIISGVAGFLAQGMFDNCFYNYRVFLIFWIMLSLGLKHREFATSTEQNV